MRLSLLYRGPLSSCNYACSYCPFAKRFESKTELDADRQALERFVCRVEALPDLQLSVLFTPWGEALVRAWYRRAFARLSQLPHVEKVVAQTNLSGPLRFLDDCDPKKVALWATFHPAEVTREAFLRQVDAVLQRGVRLSVGAVAVDGALPHIEALRRELPAEVYLWVNAAKRVHGPYSEEDFRRLEGVDPLFGFNAQHHESLGQRCYAGERAVSIDAVGVMRRCHFLEEVIGNFYDDRFREALKPRRCPAKTCGCHIGYVHLERLGLYEVFGDGVLERIPRAPIRERL